MNFNGYVLPKVKGVKQVLEIGGPYDVIGPLKQSALDVTKGLATDLTHSLDTVPHKYKGICGLNVLFPDAHVKWQDARANPQAFNPILWKDVGSNELIFRRLANTWQP